MRSSLMVAAVVVLGACAAQSAERSDGAHGAAAPAANAPAANAPAARPAPVKCVRDMDCEGVEVCYEGFCRR
ncbi:MAG: hypothetical protein ACJ79L_14810 [Anaeromyxobacteraceae bacterium]